jgi:hypothetical protein
MPILALAQRPHMTARFIEVICVSDSMFIVIKETEKEKYQ